MSGDVAGSGDVFGSGDIAGSGDAVVTSPPYSGDDWDISEQMTCYVYGQCQVRSIVQASR